MAVASVLGAEEPPDLFAMIRIPAGPFVMGGGDEADENPPHIVTLPEFWIDRDEVTRERYLRCVQKGVCSPAGGSEHVALPEDLPISWVRWTDAETFCRHLGKRLPSEAEWEKAARGVDGRRYPWGNEAGCERANFGNFQGEGRCPLNPGRLAPVGAYPLGDSPYGVRDLAGNVWEWVADFYREDYYRYAPKRDPRGPPAGALRVVRGGACCSMFGLPRAANRLAFPAQYRDLDIGFRCAKNLR